MPIISIGFKKPIYNTRKAKSFLKKYGLKPIRKVISTDNFYIYIFEKMDEDNMEVRSFYLDSDETILFRVTHTKHCDDE